MGRVNDSAMSCYQESFENHLDVYSILYALIGRIELTLRNRIPLTLGVRAGSLVSVRWYAVLEFDLKSRLILERTLRFRTGRDDGFEKYLPLTFWINLFSLKNYESLWIPNLHSCFPNLKNAKSKRGLKEINYLMKELRRIRNYVAHYNFDEQDTLAKDRENLARIQSLLGLSVS
jgi:hypothetical protein